jgi:hypothetical protein
MTGRLQSERGLTLIETTIAVSMLLVAMMGLLSMAGLATMYTENHGHLEARTTEYAQDKMEQLLAITYSDLVADTCVFPAANTGAGTGLALGGSTDPAAPATGYVDWLTYTGELRNTGTSQPTDWYYERVWKIECATASCTDSPPTGVKKITVVTTVKSSIGRAIIPKSTVSAFKAAQF